MTRRKREIVGLRNERDFPYLVELALPPGGFRGVFLEIDAFHRERRIPVRRGRTRHVVGTSGRSLERSGVVTASANSWPALTLPRIVERESTIIETWPPIRSPIA